VGLDNIRLGLAFDDVLLVPRRSSVRSRQDVSLRTQLSRRWELAEGDDLVIRERPSGDFSRTLTLSEGLDASKLSAHYENGVLVLAIPVAEMAMARKITVSSRADDAVIEAPEAPAADNGHAEEAPVHTGN